MEIGRKPKEPCSRAQIVTFLWRAAGSPQADAAAQFPDISASAWYAQAVRWAASLGIVQGYGNDCFGPEDEITREQLAVMLYRFAKAQGQDTTQGGMAVREYSDFEELSHYAGEAMAWAVNTGVLQGYQNRLMPRAVCDRAQTLTLLYRTLAEK